MAFLWSFSSRLLQVQKNMSNENIITIFLRDFSILLEKYPNFQNMSNTIWVSKADLKNYGYGRIFFKNFKISFILVTIFICIFNYNTHTLISDQRCVKLIFNRNLDCGGPAQYRLIMGSGPVKDGPSRPTNESVRFADARWATTQTWLPPWLTRGMPLHVSWKKDASPWHTWQWRCIHVRFIHN